MGNLAPARVATPVLTEAKLFNVQCYGRFISKPAGKLCNNVTGFTSTLPTSDFTSIPKDHVKRTYPLKYHPVLLSELAILQKHLKKVYIKEVVLQKQQ